MTVFDWFMSGIRFYGICITTFFAGKEQENPGAVTLGIGNPYATGAEQEKHQCFWKILKYQHEWFINIGYTLPRSMDYSH